MKEKAGAKGKNLTANARKKPTQAEIARHIAAVKKRLTFHPFQKQEGTP
jgi:hypothetical protein